MIKIVYIISGVNDGVSFEWQADLINSKTFELSYIFLDGNFSNLEKQLIAKGFKTNSENFRGPFSFLFKLLFVIRELWKSKPDIVHTHYRTANNIGILAAFLLRIKLRVHTRHNGTYNHLHFPRAVKIDLIVNRLSSHIIAISESVKQILIKLENVPQTKIEIINHGFDLKWLKMKNTNEISEIKKKYNVETDCYPVIGVISRYVNWKGHFFIIEAFRKLIEDYPNAVLMLANASGPDKIEIQEKLSDEIPKKNFIEIGFEKDIPGLYSMFDVFVHVPIDSEVEAFGQIYIESLAIGIPSVFTLSGIASEFIINGYNAMTVPHKDSESILVAINDILRNKELRSSLSINGMNSVEKYDLNKSIQNLEHFYKRIIDES